MALLNKIADAIGSDSLAGTTRHKICTYAFDDARLSSLSNAPLGLTKKNVSKKRNDGRTKKIEEDFLLIVLKNTEAGRNHFQTGRIMTGSKRRSQLSDRA
jgi:hypothetical protein